MVNKKYEFTGETKKFSGRTLKRIKRISDGVIGGWIESEENLSHEGWCFIYGEAIVCDEARVYGEAIVCGKARVYDEAVVYGKARVYDEAEVYDEAVVYGKARVYDEAEVYGKARVYGEAIVCDEARVYDEAVVYGKARVYDEAEVYDEAVVYGKARVYDEAEVYGKARVYGKAVVYGEARVYGEAEVDRFKIIGKIASKFKYIFQLQCQRRLLTALLKDDGQILYSIGCQTEIFKDTFIDRIYNHGDGLRENPHRQEYLVAIELAEKYFESMQKLDGNKGE